MRNFPTGSRAAAAGELYVLMQDGRNEETHRIINWERLARAVGALGDNGESGGSDLARCALVEILGPDEVKAAVDFYVGSGRGAALARSVLWLLRPWPAMLRCREILQTSSDIDRRRSAIDLLRVVADKRALPWVPELLRDPDPGIQLWGAGVVDQLLWSELVEAEDCGDLLAVMASHSNEGVREMADFIRSFLRSREGPPELVAAPDPTR